MTPHDHPSHHVESVTCAILTVSDTRTEKTDKSGALIRERLMAGGHAIMSHDVIPDELLTIRDRVRALCADNNCRAILLCGGTGIASRDVTVEAVAPLLEKRLDGFGELFRLLSYHEIGAAAMLSGATAGVCDGTMLFCMPGSPAAVQLAMDRLILPQLGHMASLLEPT